MADKLIHQLVCVDSSNVGSVTIKVLFCSCGHAEKQVVRMQNHIESANR